MDVNLQLTLIPD